MNTQKTEIKWEEPRSATTGRQLWEIWYFHALSYPAAIKEDIHDIFNNTGKWMFQGWPEHFSTENRLSDMVCSVLKCTEGRQGGPVWKCSALLYSQGACVRRRERCSMSCGSLAGSGVWGWMDACAHMAESLCCSPETSTTLLTGYTSTQTFKENFVTVFIKIPTEDGITGLSAHSPNRRSVTLIPKYYMGYTWIKKLIIVDLKFKCNWALCIFTC